MTCTGCTQAVWAAGRKHTYTHTHTMTLLLSSLSHPSQPVLTPLSPFSYFWFTLFTLHVSHSPSCLLMATFIGNTSLLRSLEGRLFEWPRWPCLPSMNHFSSPFHPDFMLPSISSHLLCKDSLFLCCMSPLFLCLLPKGHVSLWYKLCSFSVFTENINPGGSHLGCSFTPCKFLTLKFCLITFC